MAIRPGYNEKPYHQGKERFQCVVCRVDRMRRRPGQVTCSVSDNPECQATIRRRREADRRAKRIKRVRAPYTPQLDALRKVGDEVESRYRAGESLCKIARAMRGDTRLTEVTVRQILVERGVPIRLPSGKKP